ncbi:MAG TPA: PAS domain-containing sensor histidine kinase [Candidatus Baltobacteraceae bacterium]|nr:PAS domain-containing sensor histidine kinase [Candidatus Baltobacteraceae bacterium]
MDIGRTLPADVSRGLLDELVESKALVEAYARVAAEGIIHLDGARRIARFNASAERILGYSPLGVIGTDFSSLLHESNRGDVFASIAPSDPRVLTLALRDSRGAGVPVRARCVTVMSGDAVEGWLIAFHAKQRVEEIEQLKNELVSTVSHELKTPLAAIKAYTATLRENPSLYDTHRQEFLGVVEHEADRLSRIVDDMLLVTRVDTAQLLRKRVLIDLDRLLDEVIGQIQHNPVTHPIERRFSGVQVSGDPDRLRDILRNLLENAVKYSPEGGPVEVLAAQETDRTVLEVRDTGVGIAEEHLPYIFDRFYRAEDEATSSVGGSGLGLYIVQALVRAHGGSIDVFSDPGSGTTFKVSLPVRQ